MMSHTSPSFLLTSRNPCSRRHDCETRCPMMTSERDPTTPTPATPNVTQSCVTVVPGQLGMRARCWLTWLLFSLCVIQLICLGSLTVISSTTRGDLWLRS